MRSGGVGPAIVSSLAVTGEPNQYAHAPHSFFTYVRRTHVLDEKSANVPDPALLERTGKRRHPSADAASNQVDCCCCLRRPKRVFFGRLQ